MSMAGELIGEKAQEKLFGQLLKREENQNCADCKVKSPTWVSLDFGIFVCMNCSGAHRHLSRNVTRVYSIKIDSWNKNNFQIMDHVGNEIANSYWEYKKPTRTLAPNSSSDDRVRFVTEKYIRKLYSNPKSQNPVITFLQQREKGILERPYQNKENISKGQSDFLVNEKEFASNAAACSQHNDFVQKKQIEIAVNKHQFSSVNSPPLKPVTQVNLLFDFDDVPQHNPKQQLIDLDDDTFSNFVQAPQPKQKQQNNGLHTQNSSKIPHNFLDLYSNAPTHHQSSSNSHTTNNNGGHSNITNTNNMNNLNSKPQFNNSIPQTTSTFDALYNLQPSNNFYNSGQQSQQQHQQQQQQSYNYRHHSCHTSNTAPHFQNFNPNINVLSNLTGINHNQGVTPAPKLAPSQVNQGISPATKSTASVDLMTLYNQQKQTNTTPATNATAPITHTQMTNPPQTNNQIPVVDKNRYSAFNQMPQYGAYQPYYGGYSQNQQTNMMSKQIWQ